MKIKNQSSTGKKVAIIIAIVALLAVVAGGVLYLYLHPYTANKPQPAVQKSHIDLNPPTKDQVDTGNTTKQQSLENSSGSTANQTDAIQTDITTASVDGDTLYIRNTISGVHQDGACTVILTKGSSVITKASGLQALAQSSTCQGFNIPISQLSSGTWTIKLTVTIGGQSATATSTVTI